MCSSCLFPHGTFSLHSWRSITGRTQRAGLRTGTGAGAPQDRFPNNRAPLTSHSLGTVTYRSPSPPCLPFAPFPSHPAVRAVLSFFSSSISSVPPWNISMCKIFRTGSLPTTQPWIPPQGNEGTKRVMTRCFTPKPAVTLSPLSSSLKAQTETPDAIVTLERWCELPTTRKGHLI